MTIGGIILLIIAAVCFFFARSQAGKLQAMNAADTYTAQLLKDIHGQVTGSLGAEALAQRVVEHALPLGTQVYVLGCARDYQGQPIVARNLRDSKARFMISRRSERELAQSAAAATRNFYYAAAGSGVVGLVLLVIGLV